jgi:hypothetical protein
VNYANGTEPRERWFGTGEAGFVEMFSVWGESEPINVAGIPLRRAHTGTLVGPDGRQALNDVVDGVLAEASRPRRLMDPRDLWATQHGVTWSGVNFYLRESRYQRTGWTWAQQSARINREIVVWSSPRRGPVLLSGHHRTVVSLLRGEPVDVVWVEFDDAPNRGESDCSVRSQVDSQTLPETGGSGRLQPGASKTQEFATPPGRSFNDGAVPTGGKRVTQLVWVGNCPYPHQRVESASAAEPLVRDGTRCVLPSIGMAEQLLLLLGAGQRWVESVIAFATSGRLG